MYQLHKFSDSFTTISTPPSHLAVILICPRAPCSEWRHRSSPHQFAGTSTSSPRMCCLRPAVLLNRRVYTPPGSWPQLVGTARIHWMVRRPLVWTLSHLVPCLVWSLVSSDPWSRLNHYLVWYFISSAPLSRLIPHFVSTLISSDASSVSSISRPIPHLVSFLSLVIIPYH